MTIRFGSPMANFEQLEDSGFLASIRWRKSADRKLVEAAGAGDVDRFTRMLRRSLTRRWTRASRKRTNQRLPQLLQPLWSQRAWEDPATAAAVGKLLLELQEHDAQSPPKVSRRLSRQVNTTLDRVRIEASPWTQSTWMIVLAMSAGLLDDRTLFRLWRESLLHMLPQVVSIDRPDGEADFIDDRQLLLRGELPWVAGLVFSDIKGAGRVLRLGRTILREQLEATTDADGTPHGRAMHRLPLTLAVLTRSVSLGRSCGEELLNSAAADRYEQFITKAAVLAQADGRLALSNGASFAPGSLLRTASKLAGLSGNRDAGRRLRILPDDAPGSDIGKGKPQNRLPKPRRVRRSRRVAVPSTQSDWAEVACLRNNWSAGGDSCIVAYHDVFPQLNVTAFERTLIDGAWSLSVEVDGVAAELSAEWSCVCWFSDDDADYVELQQTLADGTLLNRQVLLSRTDHWLMLADNIRLDAEHEEREDRRIEVTSKLPLSEGVQVQSNRWTRDLELQTQRLSVRAFPLSLPQERVENASGDLRSEDGVLTLRQVTRRGSLQLPLVLDWSPDRAGEQGQWQQLTVAEDGQRLGSDVACGYRLRVGRHQWVFYRSHRKGATGRTVLGHHTHHETVIAEFTGTGEVEPIVLVESETADE